MNVLFLQTAHLEKDDRVWYHQRASLIQHGSQVAICSTLGQRTWCAKWKMLRHAVRHSQPDVIIADTPFAILCAGVGKKVIWDITEFYPSKKDIHGGWLLRHWQRAYKRLAAHVAAWVCDAFIYGEDSKYAPYQHLNKPHLHLPYYPSKEYVPFQPVRDISRQITLLYAGPQTAEKGWHNVLKAIDICRQAMPQVTWQLDTMSNVPFEQFCQRLPEYDLFLDLRPIDSENTQCLPIKLFYYLAAGRPSVYSRLAAIEQGFPEAAGCLSLVTPDCHEETAAAIMHYVKEVTDYQRQAHYSREVYLSHYTWEQVSPAFISFVYAL